MRLAWRVDVLDKWRESVERDRGEFRRELEGKLSELRAEIENVTKAQEIAKAVATELSKSASPPAERVAEAVAQRGAKLHLSLAQKIGGFAMGAIFVADAIRGLVS